MKETIEKKNPYLVPFILVTSLFFLWAFIHNLNPILIPHLKKACQLSDTQSAFIDSAVYIAYFLMALPAGFVMKKYGYKRGIVFGLLLYALGAFLFIPAASTRVYSFFLVALFIVAGGAAFLETAANPYITVLGDRETSEQRLNFAQSFNGVGAFIAPIVGGAFILSGVEHSTEQLAAMPADELNTYLNGEASNVKIPYLVIGLSVFIVAVLFMLTKLPEVKEPEDEVSLKGSKNIFMHRQLLWGVVAQFFYVGAQVGVGSFFIRFSKYTMNMPEKEAAYKWGFIAMVGFMVGRFFGTFLMKYIKPQKLLLFYSFINIVLLLAAVYTSGTMAVWSVLLIPFFMSIMFPTIFALGVKDLGEDTKLGASLLIMSIVGGAIIPIFMGLVSDANNGNIQLAYLVPIVCFVVTAWYGWKGYRHKFAAS
ncbi:MAG: L-fucose:H+ symporter permease [Chitinophagaceae bacterium]|nr:L-fucose:H+ symporter permease [Chitinophagaceae bacterium]